MSEINAIPFDPIQAIEALKDLEIPDESEANKAHRLIDTSALTRRLNGKKIKGDGEYLTFRAYALCPDSTEYKEAMKTVLTLENRAKNWGFALQMMKLGPVSVIALFSFLHYVGGVRVPRLIEGIGPAQWGILVGTLMSLNPLPLAAGVLHTMVTGGKWFGMQGFLTRGGLAFLVSASLMYLVHAQAQGRLNEAWEERQEIQDGMRLVYGRIHKELYKSLKEVRDSGNEEDLDWLADTAEQLIKREKDIRLIYGANADDYERQISQLCRRIQTFVVELKKSHAHESTVDQDLIREAVRDFDDRRAEGGPVTAPVTLEERLACITREIERLEAELERVVQEKVRGSTKEIADKLSKYEEAREQTLPLQQARNEEIAAAKALLKGKKKEVVDEKKREIKEKYGEDENLLRDAYVLATYASRGRNGAEFAQALEEYRTGLRGATYVQSTKTGHAPLNRPEFSTWIKQKICPRGAELDYELLLAYDVYLWMTREKRKSMRAPADTLFEASAASDGSSESSSATSDSSSHESSSSRSDRSSASASSSAA